MNEQHERSRYYFDCIFCSKPRHTGIPCDKASNER